MLNNHNQYDVSQEYMISGKSQMMGMLFKFANYVQSNDIICESLSEISDKEFISLIRWRNNERESKKFADANCKPSSFGTLTCKHDVFYSFCPWQNI